MKKLSWALLIIFTLLAVVLNFLPHLNYPYPLHVDEYVHFQYSNHLSQGTPLYFGGESQSLEAGFHYILSVLNSIGVPYLFMFRFFPSLITVLICLGVFIFVRKIWNEEAGVYSILFIALLKSSVMILGPVFLVPMAIGLFFIPVILYLIKIDSKAWILPLASILIIHPPTAVAILLLINIEFIILKKKWLKNIGFQAISGLIALPFYLNFFITRGTDTINALSFTPIVNALFVPAYLGWALVFLALAGIYFTLEKKKYSLTIYSAALLVFIILFYQFRVDIFIPYARDLMYLFVIFSTLFGIGVIETINLGKKNRIKWIVGIIIIALVLITIIPAKLDSNNNLYHIMNEQDYNSFVWIRDNTPQNSIVLADPWKADALSPISERQVYSRIMQGPNAVYEENNKEINDFFSNNCTNIDFLNKNNISVVYGNCSNSSLKEVYPKVYLVR
jgi:hypothetical protein